MDAEPSAAGCCRKAPVPSASYTAARGEKFPENSSMLELPAGRRCSLASARRQMTCCRKRGWSWVAGAERSEAPDGSPGLRRLSPGHPAANTRSLDPALAGHGQELEEVRLRLEQGHRVLRRPVQGPRVNPAGAAF